MSSDSLFLKRLLAIPKVVTQSVTRPNDTTTYTAGDALANATSGAAMLTFSNMARKAGGGFILQRMVICCSAKQTLLPDMEIFFLDTTMATPPVDNTFRTMTDAESETVIGSIFVPGQVYSKSTNNTSGAGGNIIINSENLGMLMCCAAGSTSIYCVPSFANAYVPVANEKFTFKLFLEQL